MSRPGAELATPFDAASARRFLGKIRLPDGAGGCWEWAGGSRSKGYGKVWFAGAMRWAHRVSYVLFVGPIEAGQDIHHTCHSTMCVNPWHLQSVTRSENVGEGNRWRNGNGSVS